MNNPFSGALTESLAFSRQCFVEAYATKQFHMGDETIFRFGADIRKQPLVIK